MMTQSYQRRQTQRISAAVGASLEIRKLFKMRPRWFPVGTGVKQSKDWPLPVLASKVCGLCSLYIWQAISFLDAAI